MMMTTRKITLIRNPTPTPTPMPMFLLVLSTTGGPTGGELEELVKASSVVGGALVCGGTLLSRGDLEVVVGAIIVGGGATYKINEHGINATAHLCWC